MFTREEIEQRAVELREQGLPVLSPMADWLLLLGSMTVGLGWMVSRTQAHVALFPTQLSTGAVINWSVKQFFLPALMVISFSVLMTFAISMLRTRFFFGGHLFETRPPVRRFLTSIERRRTLLLAFLALPVMVGPALSLATICVYRLGELSLQTPVSNEAHSTGLSNFFYIFGGLCILLAGFVTVFAKRVFIRNAMRYDELIS
jgi:hypothetical protein